MKALIDADQVAIASAFTAQEEPVEIACARAGSFIETILADTEATSYELWLSGGKNFRYDVYPEYKANRRNTARPIWEQEVKQYLIENWQANVTDGLEADDMLGIRHLEEAGTILCHQDKDLNQIKGLHYNWESRRLGVVIRERQWYTVSPEDADYWFFYQLLVGDTTDNIKGVVGIGPKKAAGILHGCENNQERYEAVAARYASEEELDMNARCVYIMRKHNDHWRNILGEDKNAIPAQDS